MKTVALAFLVLLLIVVLFFFIRAWLNRSHRHRNVRPEQLPRFIETLYKRGYYRGFMILQSTNRNETVQFMKNISEEGDISLNSHFFPVEWVEPYRESIYAVLDEMDIEYEIITGDHGDTIEIRLGQDINLCADMVTGINSDVFGISLKEQKYKIWFQGVTEDEVLINSRN